MECSRGPTGRFQSSKKAKRIEHLQRITKQRCQNNQNEPVDDSSSGDSEQNQSQKAPVVEGRRIVDIQHVAQQLKCLACKRDIFLRDIVKEVRQGLASVFYVECSHQECRYTTMITTGTQHGRVFDVNTKLAMGKCSNLCQNMHWSYISSSRPCIWRIH